ncbi:MAG: hypothetical protein ACKPJN_10945 [Microcystis panniformis]
MIKTCQIQHNHSIHSIIQITVNGGGALRRIVSLKLKQKFWPSIAPYVCLDVVKISLDQGDLT